ncbi:MAG: hypothetical protein P1V97_39765 [Planctomycetota bacterium]|nr:hypothetical protein [Planctomycetota bacterium]
MSEEAAKATKPFNQALWFFSSASGLGGFILAVLTGHSLAPALLASGLAFVFALVGLRLGFLLLAGGIIIPMVITSRTGTSFLGVIWVGTLIFFTSAYLRSILVGVGLAQKRHHLKVGRSTETGSELDTDSPEGPLAWLLELIAATAVILLLYISTVGFASVFQSFISDKQMLPEQKMATVVMLIVIGLGALGHFVFTLLNARKSTRIEAALTIMATLHRELRSELLFFTQFRARRARGKNWRPKRRKGKD